MKKCLVFVAPVGVLCAFLLLGSGRGQPPADFVPVPNEDGATRYSVVSGPGGYGVGAGGTAQSEIGQLMHQLREASDEAKKVELTKKLEAAVTKSFDEDMKARDAELTKMEERLKKLKEQMDRRRKAKVDIIQLQIKVLTNEAEGLEFSRTPTSDNVPRGVIYGPNAPGAGLPALPTPAPRR